MGSLLSTEGGGDTLLASTHVSAEKNVPEQSAEEVEVRFNL